MEIKNTIMVSAGKRCVHCGHPSEKHTVRGRCTMVESGTHCDYNRKSMCECRNYEPIGGFPKKTSKRLQTLGSMTVDLFKMSEDYIARHACSHLTPTLHVSGSDLAPFACEVAEAVLEEVKKYASVSVVPGEFGVSVREYTIEEQELDSLKKTILGENKKNT